eukprot:TRINITY_DN48860_c0_g1_i1.p1 TRINITY_DN48860_c0_g1~~TRINITY_DN48860_c0_g1_i1.p1  ORF type:complete len:471 (-),score=77.61 TRINITY_DN48860_c0_g1_i1:250-1590(-)
MVARVASIALVVYLVFVPMTVFCALGLATFALMVISAVVVVSLEMVILADRWGITEKEDESDPWKIVAMCQDMFQAVRIIMTTLIPILLMTAGGGSFLMTEMTQRHFGGDGDSLCNVNDLSAIQKEGFASFTCKEAYVALEFEVASEAWRASDYDADAPVVTPGEEPTHCSGRCVYVAPVFASREDLGLAPPKAETSQAPTTTTTPPTSVDSNPGFGPAAKSVKAMGLANQTDATSQNGALASVDGTVNSEGATPVGGSGTPPVAWAVSAGRTVHLSECEDAFGRFSLCGSFMAGLRDRLMNGWPGDRGHDFGMLWGFNLTHVSDEALQDAVKKIKIVNAGKANFDSKSDIPFIITETARQFFGIASSLVWAAFALLTVGVIDRIVNVLEFVRPKPAPPPKFVNVIDPRGPAAEIQDSRGTMSELGELLTSPMHTTVPASARNIGA